MRFLTTIVLLFLATIPAFGDEIVVSGDISQDTVWSATLVRVVGDVTVQSGVALTIMPNVTVLFEGNYTLKALGHIQAIGTQNLLITFQGLGSGTTWNSIRLENPTTESRFKFCTFSGADTGVNLINSPVTIENCLFDGNKKGINVFGVGNTNPPRVQILSTFIQNCQQNGIFVVENSNTLIQNCDISACALDNGARGAVQLSNQSANGVNNPTLSGNRIHHNMWQGLTAFDVTGRGNIRPIIENNVVEYNLSGVYFLYASGIFRNNVIQHNFVAGNTNSGAGVMLSGAVTKPTFVGNTITGNFTGFYIVGNASPNLGDVGNGATDDDGNNHIYGNVDVDGDVWSIYVENGSAGAIMAENNMWDSENPTEIAATICDGHDTTCDGGKPAGQALVDFDPIARSTATEPDGSGLPAIVAENFPNPFTVRTTISYSTGNSGPCEIRIFNVSGQWVRTLAAPTAQTGSVVWDGRDAAGREVGSGVYLYRLVNPDKNQVLAQRRMVLAR